MAPRPPDHLNHLNHLNHPDNPDHPGHLNHNDPNHPDHDQKNLNIVRSGQFRTLAMCIFLKCPFENAF